MKPGIPVAFASRTPATFAAFFSRDRAEASVTVTVTATWYAADAGAGAPAVIAIPGSSGVVPAQRDIAQRLAEAGISVLLVDPFGCRGIDTTRYDQVMLPWAASTWDVLAAQQWLMEEQQVAAGSIGAVGFSRGGTAVLMAATLPSAERAVFAVSPPLRAVYAAYPWCGIRFAVPAGQATRFRLMVGTQDDWVDPEQCADFAEALRQSRHDVSFWRVPGAHHAWDWPTPVTFDPRIVKLVGYPVITVDDCGRFNEPGATSFSDAIGERDIQADAMKRGCVAFGVHYGSSGAQPDQLHPDLLAFFQALR